MSGFPAKSLHGQMSESFLIAAILSLSGGLQDAYTCLFRGGVFTNGQTGNLVLLSLALFDGDWAKAARYLAPIAAFALGVAAAELIRRRCKASERIHWRQLVLLAEILILFFVAFLPNSLDMLANILVSFSCAMQVQAFRKVNGCAYASTMCTGDMRSGTEALVAYAGSRSPSELRRAGHYFGVILLFALGAGLGSRLVLSLGTYMIWLSCLLLAIGLLLMFIREEEEEKCEARSE